MSYEQYREEPILSEENLPNLAAQIAISAWRGDYLKGAEPLGDDDFMDHVIVSSLQQLGVSKVEAQNISYMAKLDVIADRLME